MTDFLVRCFIKQHERVQDEKVREQYGKFAGMVGILTNIVLAAIKFFAGTVFHSVAIIGDAVNNLSDSITSIITLVGFKMSGKPADEEHPYGHARMEYISGLVISITVLMVGFRLAQSAFEEILNPKTPEFSLITVAILGISVLIKYWQSRFYHKISKKIASTALAANGMDSRNDVFSTLSILAGIAITYFTGYNLDGWIGMIVAVLILINGVQLITETSNSLLGQAPTKELVDKIYAKIMSYDGVLGLHDLEVHMYGPTRCFASLHCEVPAEQDVLISHEIIDKMEHDVLQEMNIHLVIHMDPVITDDAKTNALKQQIEVLISNISPKMTMHDFRVVWGENHSNLIFDVCVPFGFSMTDEEITARVKNDVKQLNSAYYAVITVDHSYVPPVEILHE